MMNKFVFFASIIFIFNLPARAQKEFSFGCIKDTSIKEFEVFPVTRGELPSSYSLFHLMPKIKSQGNIGSCVSWSTVYGAMTIVKRIENGDFTEIPFSAMAVHSAYRDYYDSLCKSYTKKYGSESSITKHSCRLKECSEGAYPREILERLKKYGTRKMFVNEPNSPCPQENSTTIYEDKIYDFSTIYSGSPVDFKNALLANSPIILVIDHYNLKDWSDDQYFNDGVWDGIMEGDLAGSHAMLIVGYDDNKAGGAIHVVNSWGDDFGVNGTFWIKYEDLKKIQYACRIKLDPNKNNDLAKIDYKSNTLKNIDDSQLVGFSITSENSNSNSFFIEKSNGTTVKVDYNNKETQSLGNIAKLKYSYNRKYVSFTRDSNNEVILLKNNKKDWLLEKNINLNDIPKSSFFSLNLNQFKISKIKSIQICDNTKGRFTYKDKEVRVVLITMEGAVFVWSPYNNKVKEIFRKKRVNQKLVNESVFVNDIQNSIVAITKKGAVLSYDVFNNRYAKSFENVVSFKANSFLPTDESHLLIGESTIQKIILTHRPCYNGWTRMLSILKTPFPIKITSSVNKVSGVIEKIEYNKSIYSCFVLVSGVLYKYDMKKSKLKQIESINDNPIRSFCIYGTKNLCIYSDGQQLFLQDLSTHSVLNNFNKINKVIGVSSDGTIVALDEKKNPVLFDSRWLY